MHGENPGDVPTKASNTEAVHVVVTTKWDFISSHCHGNKFCSLLIATHGGSRSIIASEQEGMGAQGSGWLV